MAKKMPDFESEKEEKEFWKTHDVREYINWDNAPSFVDRVFRNKKNKEEFFKDLEDKK
ncbi:MAG: hypothetical protein GY866_02680 [Proteobacteria bacterium]|nr:hypothetical protein [Pseudomonadota bacterium]